MPRARNPKRDEAYKLWLESDGKIVLKTIAEQLGVSSSSIRKWKSQDKWQVKNVGNAPINETERYDSMKDNENAKNNHGGAPPGNKNAVSHGLFAKWLPDDTKDLMSEIYDSNPIDIIWNNIMIQYAAIIRSQKIMYVRDEFDETSSQTSAEISPIIADKEGNPIQIKATREFQYAWDKQASFLSAQSRAMGTLSNLIKQFVTLADESDKRRLKLELMQSQITKLKTETKVDTNEHTFIVDDIDDIEEGDGNE